MTPTDEVVPLAEPPPGSVFKGYEDFVVQDLIIGPRVIRYRRERWQAPDGQNLVAELPPEVRPDSHFRPTLISFIIHQYHHQHLTQPLLWEQLDQLGIDISTGQLGRIVTEGKDAFHQEKAELLPAGLEVSTSVQVDDTGARHRGHNGFRTHIGNALFACFESTDSKSRQIPDRVRGLVRIPRLADQIRQKAKEAAARKVPAALPPGPVVSIPGRFLDLWPSRYHCALNEPEEPCPALLKSYMTAP